MKTIFNLIKKVLTHNYCDTCGFTKNEVFVIELYSESGLLQCEKCYKRNKIMKQETLEEAAEIYVKADLKKTPLYSLFHDSFIAGAKWQAERMYSEEDMREAIFTSFLLGVDRGNYSKELEDDLLKQFKKK